MAPDEVSPRSAVDVAVVRSLRWLALARPAVRVAVGATLAVGAVALDWWSGPTTSMLLAYSVAVALVAWLFAPRWPAVAVALAVSLASGALVALSDDGLVPARIVWLNAGLRAATLVLFAVVVSAFRRHLVATEHLALVDALTGVSSRRAILAELDRAVAASRRTGRPTSIVFFDLDGLKTVNDARGHGAGDDLIRRFCSTVRRRVRPMDSFGRIGGDEFLLVCPDADGDAVVRIVERICGHDDLPACSWGVATGAADADRTTMLAAADAGMYAWKRRSTDVEGHGDGDGDGDGHPPAGDR